jgi:hypothetical protein
MGREVVKTPALRSGFFVDIAIDRPRKNAMNIRELIDILRTMDPEREVFVTLLKIDGTGERFDIEEIRDNEGHAQLEIYEEEPDDEEPVAEETEPA